jgi:hypothetical protein
MVQLYSDDNKIYSVDMMIAYIHLFRPTPTKINVDDYIHVLDFKGWGTPSHPISPNMVLNNPKKYKNEYKRIQNADLTYPIIISNHNIVDGVHRLTKAHIENKKQINAYVFDKALFKKFLVDKNNTYDKVDLKLYEYIELFYKRFK